MPLPPGTFTNKIRLPNGDKLELASDDVSNLDKLLLDEFHKLLAEDSMVIEEAYNAYEEMLHTPPENSPTPPIAGFVQRRAPKNPLRSPWMGKFRTGAKEKKEKILDPALNKNPIRGRLVATILTNSAIIFVFFQALAYSRSLYQTAHTSIDENKWLGPKPEVQYALGGLNLNKVRRGEIYRIFWAMWMHAGWLHVSLNVVCQIRYMWMIEPDWGFWRTFTLFIISGVSGNLFSGVCDPCSTTVGSSGALSGLMGAMIPYCIEYWHSIPRPLLIAIFSACVMVASIAAEITLSSDSWAHIVGLNQIIICQGGSMGGLLYGLMTITSVTACDSIRKIPPLSWCLKENTVQTERHIVGPDGKSRKKIVKKIPVARAFQKNIKPGCKCGTHEWAIRIIAFIALTIMWGSLLTSMFVKYEYQPPGRISYYGIRSCCCCMHKEPLDLHEFWTCSYCDVERDGSTWEEMCVKRNSVSLAETAFNNNFRKMAPSGKRALLSLNAVDIDDYEASKVMAKDFAVIDEGTTMSTSFVPPLKNLEEWYAILYAAPILSTETKDTIKLAITDPDIVREFTPLLQNLIITVNDYYTKVGGGAVSDQHFKVWDI